MNKKIMVAVEQAFIERFGPWAGWAHNTLFISELASQRDRLPVHLQPGGASRRAQAPKAAQEYAAGVNDQAALEQRNPTASGSTAVESGTSKKRKLAGSRRNLEAGKRQAHDQSANAPGRISSSQDAKADNLTSCDSGLDQPEANLSQRARRAKSKSTVGRSTAAHSGETKQPEASSSIDVAAAIGVDQAVAMQSLAKRKR